ncbi:MAG: adenosine deaminase [Spirochaetes bacterium]|nr:adenosine deaminase [Spirochaetota bacterium]
MTDLEFFAAMPKVELHVHIEGALKPDDYFDLAEKNAVELPVSGREAWRDFYKFTDFDHFIQVYTTSAGILRSAADYKFIVERFFALQASQNIRYTEAFMSAAFMHTKDNAEVLYAALAEALAEGRKKYGIEVRLIPDFSREIPGVQNAVAEFILQGAKRGVFIGAGLGGVEQDFPAALFKDNFDRLRAEGLRIPVHAGEAAGAWSVRDAVEILKAERIGHGLNLMQDAELIRHFRETRLPVEVSPTSNYCLNVVSRSEPHPIRRMIDAGINCLVNSDDPGMFNTSLTGEYALLAAQGFTRDELWQMNLAAIDASFEAAPQKRVLKDAYNAWRQASET